MENNGSDRIGDLEGQLLTAQTLYNGLEDDKDKISVFVLISELKKIIREEEYKVRVMNGDE